jgi:hypothetical protein
LYIALFFTLLFFSREMDLQEDVLPLIQLKEGKYEPVERTMSWLRSMTQNVSIVSCVGKYRTGKSFFLNALCRTTALEGFGVGNTTQSETKGILICTRPILHTEDNVVLAVDTEGIDSLDASDNHDICVFTLSLLLSSVFCYNSMGAIDEAALQTLSLVTSISQKVRSKGGQVEDASFSDHMPEFVWILRDFRLKMTNRGGAQCSSREYLEEALNDDSSCGEERSSIRRKLRDSFPRRNLLPFPPPDISASNNLATGKRSNVAFNEAMDALRNDLMQNPRIMSVEGMPMTAGMYASAVEYVCSTLNQDGVIPTIKDTFSSFKDAQMTDLARRSSRKYQYFCSRPLPEFDTILQLRQCLNAKLEETIRQYETDLFEHDDSAIASVRSELVQIKQECETAKEQASLERANTILEGVKALVVDDVDGVRQHLRRLTENIYEEHRDNCKAGVLDVVMEKQLSAAQEKNESLESRLSEMKDKLTSISIQFDNKLSEATLALETERKRLQDAHVDELEHSRNLLEVEREQMSSLRDQIEDLKIEKERLALLHESRVDANDKNEIGEDGDDTTNDDSLVEEQTRRIVELDAHIRRLQDGGCRKDKENTSLRSQVEKVKKEMKQVQDQMVKERSIADASLRAKNVDLSVAIGKLKSIEEETEAIRGDMKLVERQRDKNLADAEKFQDCNRLLLEQREMMSVEMNTLTDKFASCKEDTIRKARESEIDNRRSMLALMEKVQTAESERNEQFRATVRTESQRDAYKRRLEDAEESENKRLRNKVLELTESKMVLSRERDKLQEELLKDTKFM